ncbi:hypothetical protein AB205_0216280, partial [Aquarana catesbeiana]
VQQPNISQSPGGDEDTLGKAISELKEKEASLDKEMAQLQAEYVSILRGITTKDLYSEFGLDLED